MPRTARDTYSFHGARVERSRACSCRCRPARPCPPSGARRSNATIALVEELTAEIGAALRASARARASPRCCLSPNPRPLRGSRQVRASCAVPKEGTPRSRCSSASETIGTASETRTRLERRLVNPEGAWISFAMAGAVFFRRASEPQTARRPGSASAGAVHCGERASSWSAHRARIPQVGPALSPVSRGGDARGHGRDLSRRLFRGGVAGWTSIGSARVPQRPGGALSCALGSTCDRVFEALEWLDRVDEAFAVLEAATTRPSRRAEVALVFRRRWRALPARGRGACAARQGAPSRKPASVRADGGSRRRARRTAPRRARLPPSRLGADAACDAIARGRGVPLGRAIRNSRGSTSPG